MARREFQMPSVLRRQGKHGEEFYIRYRVKVLRVIDGKPKLTRREKWHTLGLCSEMTERAAKRQRDEIMREVNGQVYTIQAQIPFDEFVTIYKEQHFRELAVPSQNTYRQSIANHIAPFFAGKKLCDIRVPDVQLWMRALDELAPYTRATVRGVFSSIFERAIEWGYWKEANPVKLVKMGKRQKHAKNERRILKPEEVRCLLLAVNDDVRLIIETLVTTGMRISECLGLRWKNVNLQRGCVKVTERQCRGDVDQPKSAKGNRTLPLGGLAQKFAARRGDAPDGALVFTKDNKPYKDCELLANYLTPIMVKLKLKQPGMGWHMFRRFHSTYMAGELNPFELAEQMGHADVKTTMLYVVPQMTRREDAVTRMQAECGIGEPEGRVM